jgi:hypothetical protein
VRIHTENRKGIRRSEMMRTLKVPRGILPVAVITMVGLAVLNAGCGGHGGVARWIRAAFIYVGPISDLGWSYAHDQGLFDGTKFEMIDLFE